MNSAALTEVETRQIGFSARVERFVLLPFSVLLPDQDKPTYEMSVTIKTSVVPAPQFLRELFGVEQGASVAMIEGQIFHAAEPIGLSVGYVPLTADEAARAATFERSTLGMLDFLEHHLGVELELSRATLGALVCDAETAARLAVTDGAPMLWLEQIIVDIDGNERGLFHARYRADRVGFSGCMQRR